MRFSTAHIQKIARKLNYTVFALILLGSIWLAEQISIAFTSGRVSQILLEAARRAAE